ncbi:uncharacterized protein Bfra_004741 [Botrytis fragariae]|uniref:Uncharacterized protein n=1 Tax=Botrytis fragariae TaxID=1964551 RepID=A0A8H6EK20_9HELO|nr:uncharacterized protein Bfra_004741 [Botrytis fragariae]KAF5874725.1 hypothetical protein Bfra_004741 [Botrytis fragariae]
MFMKLAFHVANLPIMRILGECWVNCDVNMEVPSYRQINTSDIEDIIRSLAFDMVDMDMGGGVLLFVTIPEPDKFQWPSFGSHNSISAVRNLQSQSKFLENSVQIFLEH